MILGSKSPGGARNEPLSGRSGIDLPWLWERATKEVVPENGAYVPTLPLRKKMAEGRGMREYEERKGEKHTWAFLGRKMLGGSTRKKNRSSFY